MSLSLKKANNILIFMLFVTTIGAVILANKCNAASLVDPTVEAVSIGPKSEYGIGEGHKFMVIVTVSEIYYHLYIQRISFGEEGCCKKIERAFQILDKDLSGDFEIKSFEGIKWLSWNSFIITLNENERFIVKDLDKTHYKVEKFKDKLNAK
jgi:hypothetical protein